MIKFALGFVVGLTLAIFAYGPYQIESEYLHNVKTGLRSEPTTDCKVSIVSLGRI
jgi:hypothetical protein